MLRNRNLKKVTKYFFDFTKEEQWLQSMLKEGWVLKSYESEDVDGYQYVFEPIKNEKQKKLIYKIDFREFDKKEEFEEYKVIFKDAGWTLLSKDKSYSKHIFYSEPTNSQLDIFSEKTSYMGREKRKMFSSLTSAIVVFSAFIICTILYIIFERSAFMGVGLFFLFSTVKFTIDYFKHRKVYKLLLNSNGINK